MKALRDALRRRHRSGRRALPRAARSQHRRGHGAQSVHRLREDRGDREGVGEDRPADSRAGAGARPDGRASSSIECCRPRAMTRPGIAGEVKPMKRRPEGPPLRRRDPGVALFVEAGLQARLHAQNVAPPAPRPSVPAARTSGCSKRPTAKRGRSPNRSWTRSASPTARRVADIGAGAGWFTIRLARRVGPNGIVYAQDVQRQMLEAIRRRVAREGLQNVADAPRRRQPPEPARARARRRAGRRRLSGGRARSRHVPAQPRRGAEAERAHRHRELQAGKRRPGPGRRRRRPRRERERRSGRAGRGPARARPRRRCPFSTCSFWAGSTICRSRDVRSTASLFRLHPPRSSTRSRRAPTHRAHPRRRRCCSSRR